MDGPVPLEAVFRFERFSLDPVARTVTRDGVAVPIGARLFDTLLALVRHPGELVERETLLQAVWPGRNVEEGNLSRAVSSLRELLRSAGASETLILTVPGRGYRFTARVLVSPSQLRMQQIAPQPRFIAAEAGGVKPGLRWRWATACLAALGCVAWLLLAYERRPAPDPPGGIAPPPHSVAVLPFANLDTSLDQSPGETYFSDGLSDELINALGRIAGLRVAARLSSFSFKGGQPDLADIGRQLNVGAVLEGSVRRAGGRVRVSVELIDVRTGYQLWSNRYDRATGDMLAVEAEIAEAVISSLRIVLLPGETQKLLLGGTNVARAFDSYLAGMAVFSEVDETADRRAIADFDAAIARDPNYALAFAQRARARLYVAASGSSSDVGKSQAMLAQAQQDAERAVSIAPTLAAGHAALGLVLKFALGNIARAEDETSLALKLAPGDSDTMMNYAGLQMDLGQMQEAVAAAQQAAMLDPLSANSYRKLAVILAYAGRYDDAMTALDRARRLQPAADAPDRILTGAVQTLAGDVAGAASTCAGERDYHDRVCLAWVYHQLGREAAAGGELAKLMTAMGDNGAYLYAHVYGQAGQPDEALRWLQTAYRLHDPGLIIVKIDPAFAVIRGRAAYSAILHGLGFP